MQSRPITAKLVVKELLEDDFEADLKRYSADIYRASNLDNATFKRWLKAKQFLWIDLGGKDLHTFWYTHKNGIDLIKLATLANVSDKKLVLAACACARLALKYVPAGEDRPRRAIEAAEARVRGEATQEQVKQSANAAYAYAVEASHNALTIANAASSASNATAAAYYASGSDIYIIDAVANAACAGVSESDLAEAVRTTISAVELKPKL